MSCAFASQWFPLFPTVSRSFTGMGRGQHGGPRCHFDHTPGPSMSGSAPDSELVEDGDRSAPAAENLEPAVGGVGAREFGSGSVAGAMKGCECRSPYDVLSGPVLEDVLRC